MVTEVSKVNGEATANNRKGKLIFFYEWELVLDWEGQVSHGSNTIHKGKIDIPNLSEENDLHEIDINVSVNESNDESELLKQFMCNVGRDRIRQQLGIYIKSLKEEYSRNLILPKKDSSSTTIPSKAAVRADDSAEEKNKSNSKVMYKQTMNEPVKAPANAATNNSIGCKLDVRTLDMVEDFHCSQNDLYQVLTKVEMLTAFTKTPAKADNYRGGE